jgi:hypothetical protein
MERAFRYKNVKAIEVFQVSEFSLGKGEKVNGRDAQGVNYLLRVPEEKEFRVTVWIDTKTHHPLKRLAVGKNDRFLESYQIRVNPKIADEKFQLPK